MHQELITVSYNGNAMGWDKRNIFFSDIFCFDKCVWKKSDFPLQKPHLEKRCLGYLQKLDYTEREIWIVW